MANLPTRLLRLLNTRRHALLDSELADAFPAFRGSDIDRATEQLKRAALVRWTSQGWLITEAGIVMATGGRRMTFERIPAAGSAPYVAGRA